MDPCERYDILKDQFNKIMAELATRDLRDVPTDRLIELLDFTMIMLDDSTMAILEEE